MQISVAVKSHKRGGIHYYECLKGLSEHSWLHVISFVVTYVSLGAWRGNMQHQLFVQFSPQLLTEEKRWKKKRHLMSAADLPANPTHFPARSWLLSFTCWSPVTSERRFSPSVTLLDNCRLHWCCCKKTKKQKTLPVVIQPVLQSKTSYHRDWALH